VFSLLSRRRVAALLVLTSLLLITLDRNGSPVIDRIRRGFGAVTAPFENAARTVANPVQDAWNGVSNYDELEAENARLRDELQRARGAQIANEVNALEYYELLELFGLLSAGNYQAEVARVIGDAPGNFNNTVEIDKGSRNGIVEGMPVTDGAGLVGKVTEVFADRSIVRLITDPDFYVRAKVSTGDVPPIVPTEEIDPDSTTPSGEPINGTTSTSVPPTDDTAPESDPAQQEGGSTTTTATTQPGDTQPPVPGETTLPDGGSTTTTTLPDIDVIRETGGIEGQGPNLPILFRFLDDTITLTQLRVGSPVRTAGGTGGLAPPDLPIGEVTAIKRQTGSRSPIVEVTPFAKLDQLNFVAVVLFVPGG
jgi:rod shape-determining protein MreC